MSELIGGRDSSSGWEESADWPMNLVRWVSHLLGWFVAPVRHAGYWNHNTGIVQPFLCLRRKALLSIGVKIQ